MSTMTTDAATADELAFLADTYVEQWSARLAAGWSPETILWQVENAVDTSPGLGLAFEECEGSCGKWVAGADEGSRLTLCPACRESAEKRSEEYLRTIFARRRTRKANQEAHRQAYDPLAVTTYTGHGIGHQYRPDVAR